jgi:DNA-directed RNA polymerase subunit RPC12/RpoP
MAKCPGMDPACWKLSDIVEYRCTACGAAIEFWKDDVKRQCNACGKFMFNPKVGDTCLSWCEKAPECLGNSDIKEWKEQTGKR